MCLCVCTSQGFRKSGPHFSKVLHKLHFQETPFQDFMGFVKIERFSLDLAYSGRLIHIFGPSPLKLFSPTSTCSVLSQGFELVVYWF